MEGDGADRSHHRDSSHGTHSRISSSRKKEAHWGARLGAVMLIFGTLTLTFLVALYEGNIGSTRPAITLTLLVLFIIFLFELYIVFVSFYRRFQEESQSVRSDLHRLQARASLYRALRGGDATNPAAVQFRLMARDLTPNDYEDLLQLDEGINNRAAEETTIQRLPVRGWSDESSSTTTTVENNQCSICLERFSEGTEVKTLPCLHVFHQSCIDRWLRVNGSCPVCLLWVDSQTEMEDETSHA